MCGRLGRSKRNSLVRGFTLIELLVSMFILIMVMGAMAEISVSIFQSYNKSRAIKTVSENVGFAMNSIAKDVRMGKILSTSECKADGSTKICLVVVRNAGGAKICYRFRTDYRGLGWKDISAGGSCDASGTFNSIVLLPTGMTFDKTTSGFRYQKTDTTSATKIRGWVEMNFNIDNPTMTTDSINVQTTVSSRDYGWDETAP